MTTGEREELAALIRELKQAKRIERSAARERALRETHVEQCLSVATPCDVCTHLGDECLCAAEAKHRTIWKKYTITLADGTVKTLCVTHGIFTLPEPWRWAHLKDQKISNTGFRRVLYREQQRLRAIYGQPAGRKEVKSPS